MAAGDEVLVVVDGASDIEQVFNLSINEIDRPHDPRIDVFIFSVGLTQRDLRIKPQEGL